MHHAETPATRVDFPMFRPFPRTTSVLLRPQRPESRHRLRLPRVLGMLAAFLALGSQPAQATSRTHDSMFAGLFKTKTPSVVDPVVGATLVREAAWPRRETPPPKAAYPQLRQVSLTAEPAKGRISPEPIEQGPADAFLLSVAPGSPALVNTFQPDRRCDLWEIDRADPTRLVHQRPLNLDPQQGRWIFYNAGDVVALPGNKILAQIGLFNPGATDRAYLIDLASGAARNLGMIEPDWAAGLPLHYLDSLQLTPDAVLVAYRTDKVRLAAERYVNRYDHLLLFSPRHPQGLEVARIGIDDGNVRDWRFAATRLWLKTADDRGDAPKAFDWSLDLSNVL